MTAVCTTPSDPPVVETILEIGSLTLNHESPTDTEALRTIYRTQDDDLERDGGRDAGTITVRMSVDGDYDLVSTRLGQTGDLDGLDRAIAALTAVRDQLVALYGGRHSPTQRGGRCLAEGDWGRCLWGSTHESTEHNFETEDTARLVQVPDEQVAS